MNHEIAQSREVPFSVKYKCVYLNDQVVVFARTCISMQDKTHFRSSPFVVTA